MGLVAGPLSRQPDQRGKILSSRTRKVDNRLAAALRMAAESLCRDKSYLGQYYRRMRARLGGPQAITAAAHKLVRIIYRLVTTGEGYNEGHFARIEARNGERFRLRLAQQARKLGFTPGPGNPHRGGGCFLGGVK